MRIARKINFGDFIQRAILLDEITNGKGWHNVVISPARVGATHPQHAFYRAVCCPLAKAWLTETQGEDFDEKSAHTWLKLHLRGLPVINRETGEQIGVAAKSHATYTIQQMAEFIDEVVALLESCGVRVPAADRDYRLAGVKQQ